MTAQFQGLTWDHPRGANALKAAARRAKTADGGQLVDWNTQPLEGFESHPIEDLCARYDLIVLDHPHVGEAIAMDCLKPLDHIFGKSDLARIEADTIGPCYSSYSMSGHQWALPLDAATQVMACRADLLDSSPPQTWLDVIRLSQTTGKVAMSLAGPHALLSFLSIASALEPERDLRDGGSWFKRETAIIAYEVLRALARRSPQVTLAQNPIGILAQMMQSNEVILCPLIYGYVNYSGAPNPNRVSFFDSPVFEKGGPTGSILGGTGIAISKSCKVTQELKQHLLWLMAPATQCRFIPDHAGQPSNRMAWQDRSVNETWGDFYFNTARTAEHASVRPRHNGYIAFQTDASALLREAISTGTASAEVCRQLADLFARSKQVKEPRYEDAC